MRNARKIFYISFTGLLTSMAMTACYWQSNRYLDAVKRWKTISKELSYQNPKNITTLSQQQKQHLYAFKYIEIEGNLSPQYIIITRPKGMRTGYLVLRKLTYEDKGQSKQMIALQGWCPQNWQMKKLNKSSGKFRGILRKKQTTDYLHKKMKQSDLQKYKMNTWIDLEKYMKQFEIQEQDVINSNFYFEILKPMDLEDHPDLQQYPYQYSVDNFQLPYLTPDKHRGYALFWGCTSIVGWTAILKVLKMK